MCTCIYSSLPHFWPVHLYSCNILAILLLFLDSVHWDSAILLQSYLRIWFYIDLITSFMMDAWNWVLSATSRSYFYDLHLASQANCFQRQFTSSFLNSFFLYTLIWSDRRAAWTIRGENTSLSQTCLKCQPGNNTAIAVVTNHLATGTQLHLLMYKPSVVCFLLSRKYLCSYLKSKSDLLALHSAVTSITLEWVHASSKAHQSPLVLTHRYQPPK